MSLGPEDTIFKKHAKKLTIAQMKAVSFVECGVELMNVKAAEMRTELVDLLPKDHTDTDTGDVQDVQEDDMQEDDVPEYESHQDFANVEVEVALSDMVVGDWVEVFWKGDGTWYEGEVTALDLSDKQFEIKYYLDKKQLWHNADEYKVRVSC